MQKHKDYLYSDPYYSISCELFVRVDIIDDIMNSTNTPRAIGNKHIERENMMIEAHAVYQHTAAVTVGKRGFI